MLACLAALLLPTHLVSYETLAKPLPDILDDLVPMFGKRIVCDRTLAEDRLCISVTDVGPRDLLDRIVAAVAGTYTEDQAMITVLPSPSFEAEFLARRNEALRRQHAEWTAVLATPVKVRREDVDLHELADLLTADALTSLPIEGSVVFSRPNRPGDRAIPPAIPDFATRLSSTTRGNMNWSGMDLSVQVNRQYIEISLVLKTAEGTRFFAYSKTFSIESTVPDSFFAHLVSPDPTTLARLDSLDLLVRRHESLQLSLRGFAQFKDRPWGDEPLNAVAAPTLVATAKARNKDFVAFLDDNAIARVLPPDRFTAFFVIEAHRTESGDWAVAQALDPLATRERRVNRRSLSDLASRSKAAGYFEFWDTAKNHSQPGGASTGALTLEAAAIGPVALNTLPRTEDLDRGALLYPLWRDQRLWQRLLMPEGVLAADTPRQAQDAIVQVFRSGRFSLAPNWKFASEIGLDRQIPPGASVRIAEKSFMTMIGLNREREYVSSTNPVHLAQSVARVEASKGREAEDVAAGLTEFVPFVFRRFELQIRLGDTWLTEGPQIQYFDPVDGTTPRPLEELPKEFTDAYNAALKAERTKLGGGQL
jgi:hypothetical protein